MQYDEMTRTLQSILAVTKELCNTIPESEPSDILDMLGRREELLESAEKLFANKGIQAYDTRQLFQDIVVYDETLRYLLTKKKNEVFTQLVSLQNQRKTAYYHR